MTQINIGQVKGLEDRLKEIENRIKTLEELTPTYDKDSHSIIMKAPEENTKK